MLCPTLFHLMPRNRSARRRISSIWSAGYIPLRRQGRNFVGLCPWHDDQPAESAGQSATAVIQVLGLRYRRRYFQLPDEDGESRLSRGTRNRWPTGRASRSSRSDDRVSERREVVPLRRRSTRKRCSQPMRGPNSNTTAACWMPRKPLAARDYLADRQIDQDSIARFRLGFAPPGWDWLLLAAGSDRVPHQNVRSGRSARRAGGRRWLLRPVPRAAHVPDPRSSGAGPLRSVAAFCRIWPATTTPSISIPPNPPCSPRARSFTGWTWRRTASAAAATSPEASVIVMEGYTDCIMAHQHGIRNAVAVLGTALTDRHIPLLRRYADTVCWFSTATRPGRGGQTRFWTFLWLSRSICEY